VGGGIGGRRRRTTIQTATQKFSPTAMDEEPAIGGFSPLLFGGAMDEARAFQSINVENEDAEQLEYNLDQLRSHFSNVSTTPREDQDNMHVVDVPFVVPSPSELLMDVVLSKTADVQSTSTSGLAGCISLLVCASAAGKISAVSTTVHIASARISMQELHDCGLLFSPERARSLRLMAVVSRVWRSLGCMESPKKTREKAKLEKKDREKKLPRPPTIKRADVATFAARIHGGADLSSSNITESVVAACFESSSAGMSWLGEARGAVQRVEEANEERSDQVTGLERQLAVLSAELAQKEEAFRERSARRDDISRVLAPEVLQGRLQGEVAKARNRAEALVRKTYGWSSGTADKKNSRSKNEALVREFVDSMAAVYAMLNAASLVAERED